MTLQDIKNDKHRKMWLLEEKVRGLEIREIMQVEVKERRGKEGREDQKCHVIQLNKLTD